jgi:hypothetical protein
MTKTSTNVLFCSNQHKSGVLFDSCSYGLSTSGSFLLPTSWWEELETISAKGCAVEKSIITMGARELFPILVGYVVYYSSPTRAVLHTYIPAMYHQWALVGVLVNTSDSPQEVEEGRGMAWDPKVGP